MKVMHHTSYKTSTQSGFSLIEVLVSLAIFTFVSVAAMGALLVLIDANRKAQNLQAVMTNISFAMDSMTREIRTGSHYYCRNVVNSVMSSAGTDTRDCGNAAGARALAFNESGSSLIDSASCSDSDNRRIAYRYNRTQDSIQRKICDNDWLRLTSSEVIITDAKFIVSGAMGANSTDDTPVVTIHIEGTAGDADTGTAFALQTTVTQYGLDI